jgi:ATPase subunit of ABC transporter with duplicated ATPase domains
MNVCRALFIRPHLLLLDEPTNHLDLEACVWLEEELKIYPTILVLISHSQVHCPILRQKRLCLIFNIPKC